MNQLGPEEAAYFSWGCSHQSNSRQRVIDDDESCPSRVVPTNVYQPPANVNNLLKPFLFSDLLVMHVKIFHVFKY